METMGETFARLRGAQKGRAKGAPAYSVYVNRPVGRLLAVVAVSFASLYAVRRTETVSRSLSPDVAVVGRSTSVTVRVAVRTALPTAPGTWRDTLPKGALAPGASSRGAGPASGEFPAIGSGLRGGDRTVEFRYELEALRRGVHWLGPLQLTSADPFGLARRSSLVGDRTRVVVAPAASLG